VWLTVLLLSVVQLVRTPLNLDLSGFLPSQANPTQRLLIDQMRDGVGGRLILLAIKDDSPEQLAHISRQLAARMQQSGHFSVVANGAPLPPEQLEWLMERRYLLTPSINAQSFDVATLRQSLESSLRLLASPLGGAVQAWLPREPGGAMLELLQSLAGQNPPDIQHGVWFSRDGQRALLLAYSRAPGMDALAQERALASIQSDFSHSIGKAERGVSLAKLELSGATVFAADARHQIETAARLASGLALLLVTLILWMVYRAWKPIAYSLIPLLAGLLVGAAIVGAWFGSIHGITLAFGAILIGEAADYPAYLFIYRNAGEALTATAWRIRKALQLAMLTTAMSALFMLLSDLEGLRQLGLFTATGALTAGLTTRWLLPALQPGEYHLPRLPSWPYPPRWLTLLMFAGAVIVLARTDLFWDDDLAHLSPTPPAALAHDRALRSELGAPDTSFLLMFAAPTAEGALVLSEEHQPWLDSLVRDGIITGYALAAQSLPSQAAQQARRAALPDGATLRRNLDKALEGLPFRPGSFEPFLRDIEHGRSLPLIQRSDLEGTPWAARVEALLIREQGQWIALAPLSGVSEPARLRAALEQHHTPSVTLLDIKRDTETLLSNAREQALLLMLAGVAAIALLLRVDLGSARAAARTLLPVLAAMLTTAATLLALGISLNLFHLISLLLVLGTGMNYALFFQRRAENAEDARRAGLAVGLCSLTSLAAFTCLTLTSIAVLQAIGLTVLLGTLFLLLFSASWRPRVN